MLLGHLYTMKLFTELEKSTWRARSPDTQGYIPAYQTYTRCTGRLLKLSGFDLWKSKVQSSFRIQEHHQNLISFLRCYLI